MVIYLWKAMQEKFRAFHVSVAINCSLIQRSLVYGKRCKKNSVPSYFRGNKLVTSSTLICLLKAIQEKFRAFHVSVAISCSIVQRSFCLWKALQEKFRAFDVSVAINCSRVHNHLFIKSDSRKILCLPCFRGNKLPTSSTINCLLKTVKEKFRTLYVSIAINISLTQRSFVYQFGCETFLRILHQLTNN